MIQNVFWRILADFVMFKNNILKVYPILTSGKGSFPRWRPKWLSGSYNNNYISITIEGSCFQISGSIKQWSHWNYQRLIIIHKSKIAASKMATWCLILLYIIYNPTWECGGLRFKPQQIQSNEWNYHRLIFIDKSKMAASNIATWSLQMLYLSYDSTQKGVI